MKVTAALGLAALGLLASAACGDDDSDSSKSGATTSSGSGVGGAGTGGSAAGSGGSGAGTGGSAAGTGGSGAGAGGGASVWQPAVGSSWQWQLSDLPLDLSFDVAAYDVDLFETTDSELAQLKAAGRVVICYFSAGSWESYRPDADAFPEAIKGSSLDPPFQDELWVDIRSPQLRQLMAARLDIAMQRGCDAVEPDNVDGYSNNNGLGLTAADQLDYNQWIAEQAHQRQLSVGLKNDVDQLAELEPHFDWALNEECFTYAECATYQDNFLAAGKAVFHAEYVPPGQLDAVCAVTQPLGLSTLLKNIELDAYQLLCP